MWESSIVIQLLQCRETERGKAQLFWDMELYDFDLTTKVVYLVVVLLVCGNVFSHGSSTCAISLADGWLKIICSHRVSVIVMMMIVVHV